MSMTIINFNKYLKTANKIKKTSDKQVIELHNPHIMSISNMGKSEAF